MIHSDLDSGVPIEAIRKSEKKKKILSSYREQAEDEGRELIEVVKESSRFEKMFAAIDEFSMKTPNLQLQEILEKIKEGYEAQENQHTEKAERLEKKKRNPQEFEVEINRINEALEKYKLLTKQTKEDLKVNYSGRHSSWQKDIDALKVTYPELITGSSCIESTRKHITDAQNDVQEKVDDFSMQLTQRLREALEKTGKTFKEEHQISIPKVDLKSLEEKAKTTAYKKVDRYETYYEKRWYTLWMKEHKATRVVGTKKVFDQEKFLGEFKNKCLEEFYSIVNDLPNISRKVFDVYLELFSNEMDSVIGDRQKALEKEKEKKQSNEEIISEIRDLAQKKNDIQPEKSRCIEVLEDIK